MEFVIYQGKKEKIKIGDRILYRNKPYPVYSDLEKVELLNYSEGTCCGNITKPIRSDYLYCLFNNLNLDEFRNKWEKHYKGEED